jgi:hypothetical protein
MIVREQLMLDMPAKILVKLYSFIENGTLEQLVGFLIVAYCRNHHQARQRDMWWKWREVLLV